MTPAEKPSQYRCYIITEKKLSEIEETASEDTNDWLASFYELCDEVRHSTIVQQEPAPTFPENKLWELIDLIPDNDTREEVLEWICSLPDQADHDAAIAAAVIAKDRERIREAIIKYDNAGVYSIRTDKILAIINGEE